jgi:FkbM family methyltransferase
MQIEAGLETDREVPSRSGLTGGLAGRLRRRVLQRSASRQQEINTALLLALSAERDDLLRARESDSALLAAFIAERKQQSETARRTSLAGRLNGDAIVEKETSIGMLWLEKDAQLVTPSLLEDGVWAPNVSQFMINLLDRGMTFVDVGANIGYLSLMASYLVGPLGRVIAVEPEPFNATLLRANLWRNGCHNAEVLELAAWTQDGHVGITPNPAGGAGAAVEKGAPKSMMVPCARLDSVILGHVDVMKVDCEQTDVMAIQGASGLFDANPEITVITEFFPHDDSHVGLSPPQILQTYMDLGFELSLMDADGLAAPVSKEHLLGLGSKGMPLDIVLRRPVT